ncbi:titin-like [Sabethes cyaneus]|uniref:titin-like n=1 Tax=Sabethes cyaneus TaxID=53552 RepID=UPI00237D5265|nr:titin-like [Sabethes cyaneus]
MSHRNSDNNASWGSRSSRNNDSGGSGGGYKERSWSGNRYASDNRYNNNNKDRRNYRSYGGRNERRNYDDRRGNPYRNNSSWTSNVGMEGPYMSHSRHQKNWHQNRKPDKGNTYDAQIAQPNAKAHDSDPEEGEIVSNDSQTNAVPSNGGPDSKDCEPAIGINPDEGKNDNHTSPSEEFQGFPDVDPPKAPNGANLENKDIDLSVKEPSTVDNKLDMIPQENELIKLIEDEALKMITDAEQPSCSSSLQNVAQESTAQATASMSSTQNPERRSTIDAEQVTRKLINQLTSMNKYSLKQMINNPDSKYESVLKTHARQKLRAEVRRQLRNFSLSENSAQTKTTCGMLEPDECVDSDKIPDALLEQIGKVLDLNLLDLSVGEEQPVVVPAGSVEDDDCAINQSDADYSAAEVLDKNLRLNDDDGQLHLDAEDIFARAEMLLMKGSGAGLPGSSSAPSSPTEEMFPNDQIDSIVSEESGYDKTLDLNGSSNGESKDQSIKEDPPASAEFTCFLRVSTVEELNKKVDNVSVPIEVEPACPMEIIDDPPIVLPVALENLCNTVVSEPPEFQSQDIPAEPVPQESLPDETPTIIEVIQSPKTETTVQELAEQIDNSAKPSVEDSPFVAAADEPKLETISPQEEPSNQPTITEVPCSAAPSIVLEQTPEITTVNITRPPLQPELPVRKSKSSKNYKPNLVQHEQPKRDSKYSSSRSSSSTATAPNSNPLPVTNKPYKPGPNLAALKQTGKHQAGSSSTNKTTIADDGNKEQKNQKKRDSSSSNQLAPTGNSSAAASPSKSTGLTLLAEEMQQSSRSTSPSPLKSVANRPKTPGPMVTSPDSEPKEKKKKRKRSRKRKSLPEDIGGMMLECDLRVSRPTVTPTPPPVQQQPRETAPVSNTKRNSEPEREPKPIRETRARSVDPKMISDSKRDKDKERDRYREKSRNRELDERKESEREARREKKEEHRREKEKEKESKREKDTDKAKEKEKEFAPIVEDCLTKGGSTPQMELLVVKPERERKKSPTPAKSSSRSSVDTNKPLKDTKELKEIAKESPKEPIQVEKEKEVNSELPKEKEPKKTKEAKESKDIVKDKDKEPVDNSKEKDTRECSKEKESVDKDFTVETTEKPKDKELDVVDGCSQSETKKPPKKKRNLLRGPNLVKGRREVPKEVPSSNPQTNGSEETPKPDETLSVQPSLMPALPVVTAEPAAPGIVPMNFPIHKTRRDIVITENVDPIPALRSTVSSLIHRTASPRPWKSPGEKKLIPATPLISSAPTATVTPMSPPQVERHLMACSAVTSPSAALIVDAQPSPQHHQQQPQSFHSVTSPTVAQPDVLARIGLPSAALASPQPINFGPVMTLVNQMQDIDNKMSDFQRRKMQIDSEIMRLNSEKFQIDQNSMQLQNDRFMVLNALRAALVECELSALAAAQSAAVIAPVVSSNRRRQLVPETEEPPRNKRRKPVEPVTVPPTNENTAQVLSCPELSEPEESSSTQPSTVANGSERTIRRITKISDNTQILKLFQRRRMVSEKSVEESQSEDSIVQLTEAPTPVKRRRTRTVHVIEHADPVVSSPPTGRLRSDANRAVEPKKSVEVSVPIEQPPPASVVSAPSIPTPSASASARLKKDEEIPLTAHKNLLTRQVKIVLSKLNVAGRRGTT